MPCLQDFHVSFSKREDSGWCHKKRIVEMSSPSNNKRETINREVGEALDRAFASVSEDDPDNVGTVLEIHPTEDGIRIIDTATLEVAMGEDVVNGLDNFFEEQRMEEISAAAFRGAVSCRHCGLFPCVVEREYNNMIALGTEMEEDEGRSRKEVRFVLYNYFSHVYNGYLGRGNRKKLPVCVTSEIKDHYPADPGTNYVGFIPGSANKDN